MQYKEPVILKRLIAVSIDLPIMIVLKRKNILLYNIITPILLYIVPLFVVIYEQDIYFLINGWFISLPQIGFLAFHKQNYLFLNSILNGIVILALSKQFSTVDFKLDTNNLSFIASDGLLNLSMLSISTLWNYSTLTRSNKNL